RVIFKYFSRLIMRRFIFILFIPITYLTAAPQSLFKTVVPRRPVMAGESFVIQYVLEADSKNATIRPPLFEGFRFINGPNVYKGKTDALNGTVNVQNFVYALEAVKPGKF